MSIKNRNWFLEDTSTGLKRGWRFLLNNRPTAETFKNLIDSGLFRADTEDRAKQDDGGSPTMLAGHSVISSDEDAKAGTTQKTDRTMVVQPSQLPKVASDESISITSLGLKYESIPIAVTVDSDVSIRNRFKIAFASTFVTWLNSIASSVTSLLSRTASLESTVGGHSTDIAENASAIEGLTGQPASNNIPVGGVIMWFSSLGVPTGFLPLEGGLYLIATYPGLNIQLNGKYNQIGDDPLYFRIPSVANTYLPGAIGLEGIGTTSGSNLRNITISQLPDHHHTNDMTVSGEGDHEHGVQTANNPASWDGSGTVARGDDQYKSSVSTKGSLGKGDGGHAHEIAGNVTGIKDYPANQEVFDNRPSSFSVMYLMRAL